jgi:hypothetical protein
MISAFLFCARPGDGVLRAETDAGGLRMHTTRKKI